MLVLKKITVNVIKQLDLSVISKGFQLLNSIDAARLAQLSSLSQQSIDFLF